MNIRVHALCTDMLVWKLEDIFGCLSSGSILFFFSPLETVPLTGFEKEE